MGRGDDLVQVDDPIDPRLLAAEREQALGQVAGLGGRECDLLQRVSQFRIVAGPLQGGLPVARDRDEEVVEVVGDASGELSYGLDFLGLA